MGRVSNFSIFGFTSAFGTRERYQGEKRRESYTRSNGPCEKYPRHSRGGMPPLPSGRGFDGQVRGMRRPCRTPEETHYTFFPPFQPQASKPLLLYRHDDLTTILLNVYPVHNIPPFCCVIISYPTTTNTAGVETRTSCTGLVGSPPMYNDFLWFGGFSGDYAPRSCHRERIEESGGSSLDRPSLNCRVRVMLSGGNRKHHSNGFIWMDFWGLGSYDDAYRRVDRCSQAQA